MGETGLLKLIFLLMMHANPQLTDKTAIPSAPCDSSRCELKILSWNIYMLPSLIMPSGIRTRAKYIAGHLEQSDFDIVVFQEAFNPRARQVLWSMLKDKFPYAEGPANSEKPSLRLNSGVWILSKIPLTTLGEVEFSRAQGFDMFSRKGALMVEGDHNGTLFQLIGTHLNAGETQKIRNIQYLEIRDSLLEPFRKDDVPQIICGDFNTDKGDRVSYTHMISTLRVPDYEVHGACLYSYDGLHNDLMAPGYKSQDIFDYIFLEPNGIASTSATRTFRRFSDAWSHHHTDLSDHYAVTAQISFSGN